MDATLVQLLPPDLYIPGEYVSAPCWVEPAATYVTLRLEGRPQWQRLRAREDVLTASIEVNTHGTWEILGGCTTDSQDKDDHRTGILSTATTLRVPLPRLRIPQPQVRICLACFSPCHITATVIFDDQARPGQQFMEHHSVTYDNDNEAVGLNVSSVTIGSFAVANNANRCMVVGVGGWDSISTDSVVSSINHNSSTAGWAQVITATGTDGGGTFRTSMWRKVAPSAVSSTVVVTMGGTCSELGAHALSAYDVDQTTPMGTPASVIGPPGAGTPITMNVSAAVNDLVYDVMYFYDEDETVTLTPGAGQTERAESTITLYGGAARSLIAASTEAGAATVTMSWTLTNSFYYEFALVGCALKAAVTGAATRYPFRQGVWRRWRY